MVNVNKAIKIQDNFSRYRNIKSILLKDSNLDYVPQVSICIPTYNRVETLKDTIESALRQDGIVKYDVIICDNNPEHNDPTERYMKTIVDPRVKYYKHESNIGMYGNLNRLYELSDSEFTICIHDDDILLPNFLEESYSIISKSKHIDILYCGRLIWFRGKNSRPSINFNKVYRCYKMNFIDFFYANPCPPTGMIVRTSSMKKIGGYEFDTFPSNDYFFNIKALSNINVYYYTRPLWIYTWGINESIKEQTLINFFVLDRLLNDEISLKSLTLRFLKPFAKLNYDKIYSDLIKKIEIKILNHKLEEYIKTNFTLIDRVNIYLYRKFVRISTIFRPHIY